MEFCSGFIVGVGGGGFVVEVAEVVGFFVAGELGGPFFRAFVPVDAFIF